MPTPRVARTPNILLLMVDQMRFDAMGCAGNPHIRTPALDAMAEQGVRFTQAYTPVPVCVAARHSLLTGLHCAIHGRFGNNIPDPEPSLPTLPQLLGLAGYTTQAIGKMHFRPVRRHFGFHRMQLMEEIPDYRQDDEYLMYLKEHGYGHVRWVHGVRSILYLLPQTSVIPEAHHGSTWVADRTIDFLVEHRDRPFFCFASWIAPHPPWNAPEPFASMYDPDTLPRPVGLERDASTLPPRMRRTPARHQAPAVLQRIKSLYYGNISLIDKGIGRILRALDELGLSENTLVIFTSDHGEMLGDHGAFGKHLPYEPSAHIPLLMRWPGRLEAGRTCDDLVSLLDILPTALDVARIPYPGPHPLPGASLIGRDGGGLAEPRQRLVIEYGREQSRWLALREGRWRYALYLADGWEELYDLQVDPTEETNLLLATPGKDVDPAHRRQADAVRDTLLAWEAVSGFEAPDAWRPDPEAARRAREDTPSFPGHSPRWVFRLPPAERARMESPAESLLNAIRGETTVTLESLAAAGLLERWVRAGGSLEGTPYAHLQRGDGEGAAG